MMGLSMVKAVTSTTWSTRGSSAGAGKTGLAGAEDFEKRDANGLERRDAACAGEGRAPGRGGKGGLGGGVVRGGTGSDKLCDGKENFG